MAEAYDVAENDLKDHRRMKIRIGGLGRRSLIEAASADGRDCEKHTKGYGHAAQKNYVAVFALHQSPQGG
jgi:hypothetical protein